MYPAAAFGPGGVRLDVPTDAIRRPISSGDGVTYFPDGTPRQRIVFLADAIRDFVEQHRIAPGSPSDRMRLQTVEHTAWELDSLVPRAPDERVSPDGDMWKRGVPTPRFGPEYDLMECLEILVDGRLFDVDPERRGRSLKTGALDKMWNIANRLDRLSREFRGGDEADGSGQQQGFSPSRTDQDAKERNEPRPQLIRMAVAVQCYAADAATVRRAVKRGDLTDHRPPKHAPNAPLVLDERQVAGIWPLRADPLTSLNGE